MKNGRHWALSHGRGGGAAGLVLGLMGIFAGPGQASAAGGSTPSILPPRRWSGPPPYFEAHPGRLGPGLAFLARGTGYRLAFGAVEAWLRPLAAEGQLAAGPSVEAAAVRMELVGADREARGSGRGRLPGRVQYLKGDPSNWASPVPAYERVRFDQVYAGVDIVYYAHGRQLEFDFVIAPGAAPDPIRLRFHGARAVRLGEEGDLIVDAPGFVLRLPRPIAYQQTPEGRRPIDSAYAIQNGDEVTFVLGPRDPSLGLVIDPKLVFAAAMGGSGAERAHDVAVDAKGNVYVVGTTESADFPVENASQADRRGSADAFVMKLDPARDDFIYITYLGGDAAEQGFGITADASGNAYVVGQTRSRDFPTLGPLQPSLRGVSDAFLTKLDPLGGPVFSTYLGGSGVDLATDVGLDARGGILLAGATHSSDFPAAGPGSGPRGGSLDAFVTRLNPDGASVDYSRYLGGRGFDQALALAVDRAGNAFVTGETTSPDFPLVRPIQARLGGERDAFLAALDSQGGLRFATYLGGSGPEQGLAVATDRAGHVYVVGQTLSTDFPVRGALQATSGGGFDAFLVAFPPALDGVAFSTYLGGPGPDAARAVAADGARRIYVAGQSGSVAFPDRRGGPAPLAAGRSDAFLARLDRAGPWPLVASLVGGSGRDGALGLALDAEGLARVVGFTDSPDFPSDPPAAAAAGTDLLLAAFDARLADVSVTAKPRTGAEPIEVTVTNHGPDGAEGLDLWVLQEGATIAPAGTAPPATCPGATTPVACQIPALGRGASLTFALQLRGDAAGALQVRAETTDPNPANNGAVLGDKAPLPALEVRLTGDGRGRVRSVPGGIDCGRECRHLYDRGALVRLVAEPGSRSRFAGWGGACADPDDEDEGDDEDDDEDRQGQRRDDADGDGDDGDDDDHDDRAEPKAVSCVVKMSTSRSVVARFEAQDGAKERK